MTARDHARVLLGKARDDEVAVRKLVDDPDIADAVVGFHAQQAVEKAMTAVLSAHEHAYPWTHDVRHLMELLEAAGSPTTGRAPRRSPSDALGGGVSIWRDDRRRP